MKLATVIIATFCVLGVLMHTHAKCGEVPGCIYIMQETKYPGTLYKVGGVKLKDSCEQKVKKRRDDLQTGNARPLVVRQWYQVKNCKMAERAAHGAVDGIYGINYGGGTEWCDVADDKYDEFKGLIEKAVAKYQNKNEVIEDDTPVMRDKSLSLIHI